MCGCNSRARAGETIVYRVKFRDGRADEDYLTQIEARAALTVAGVKGTITRTKAVH